MGLANETMRIVQSSKAQELNKSYKSGKRLERILVSVKVNWRTWTSVI
jgi:hypothetical protein